MQLMRALAEDGRTRGVPAHGRKAQSYLLLSRVSNLPTVWSNVLAGMCVSWGTLEPQTYAQVAAAMSLFYSGGMFLNDAFDEPFDRSARPERPIPTGAVSRGEAFLVGGALLGVAELLLAPRPTPLVLGALLIGAIVLYDYRHKGRRAAPWIMGACRGLVYLVAGASVAGLNLMVLAGAAIMLTYVATLTAVGKRAGAKTPWLVPLLIAGISLIDAAFVAAVSSSPLLAFVAACGFPLTLFLQRFVAGD